MKRERPAGVPESMERRVKQAVASSWPCVVDPELADAVKKQGSQASGLVRFPSELIAEHIQNRRKAGASDADIKREVDHLVYVFEQECKTRTVGKK